MTARELLNIFKEYFPNIVIEKWYPGGFKQRGGKRDPQAIRVYTVNHETYLFTYHTKTDWTLKRCFLPSQETSKKNGLE